MTNIQKVLKSQGLVNKTVFRSFHKWTQVLRNEKYEKVRLNVSKNHSGLIKTRLALVTSLFKSNKLKQSFELWRTYILVIGQLEKSNSPNHSKKQQSHGQYQREKQLKFQKGMLIIQNRQSMKRYTQMAQAESRMTVAKAIAIWKVNSEVCGIEGQLEA